MQQTRQLAAIMFTDIVGYTALMGKDEQKAMELLKSNREIQKPLVAAHNGRWLKEMGDGTLVSFQTASEAVYCALKIQEELKDNNDLNLRIGIHVGEIILEDRDVFGDGVNIASRLESLAPTGGIWVSEAVGSNIQNKQGIETRFVREEQLKNVKNPVRIYEVNISGKIPSVDKRTERSSINGNWSSKKLTIAVIVIMLITALVYSLYTFYSGEKQITQIEGLEIAVKSIAVLPFVNIGNDPEQEYFSDGITEDIINNLGKVGTIKVISRTSSMLYKNTNKGLKQIAEDLDVSNILEGSVRKSGNRLRITVQLIKVATDESLWSASFDREFEEIFDIQLDIAEQITHGLQIKLSNDEGTSMMNTPTTNLEAYDYYLKGREYYRGKTRIDIENSIKLHRQAIQKDPAFAQAYVGLIESYITAMSTHGYPRTWRDSIYSYAEKAYSMDQQSAEVYYALGRVNWKKKGLEYYQKALQKNPNYDLAYYYISISYYIKRDLIKAIKNLRNALEISPLDPAYQSLYAGYLFLIQMDEDAIQIANNGLELNPDNLELHSILSVIYRTLGEYDKAIIHAEDMLRIDPTDLKGLNLMGDAFMFKGEYEKSKSYYEKARKLNTAKYSGAQAYRSNLIALANCRIKLGEPEGMIVLEAELERLMNISLEKVNTFYVPFEIAAIYSIKGEKKKALEWVKKALEKDFIIHRGFLNDPFFENIKEDPTFKKIIQSTHPEVSRIQKRIILN